MSRQSNARWVEHVEHAGTKLCFVPKQCLQCLQLGLTLGFNGAALHTCSHCLSNNGTCNREAAVSNTILGSVYCWSDKYIFTFCVLVFLLDPFSHLRVLDFPASVYMRWCIWLLHFWFGIGKIWYFLEGKLWWVRMGWIWALIMRWIKVWQEKETPLDSGGLNVGKK